ncbi:MAG: acyl carrier protein [Dysgonamonadaceae bacterium]|jgi:acyl carrier protein|nr:acyl carrier protein [Dysgonamonadaceae bacterium]
MKEKIKEVMLRVFQLDEIPDNISQSNCTKWDSMNHLNLIVELEEEFDVSFEPEDIAEMKSLDLVENKLKSIH